MVAIEINFDGLVGPTHNYAGLSFGNLASEQNLGSVSRPKAAALQGLEKMKFVAGLGLVQGLLPPLKRPNLSLPRELGYSGDDKHVLQQVIAQMPQLLPSIYSASSMWVANAATVTPSCDAKDGHVHFTAANLVTHLHRTIEAHETAANLARIFNDEEYFSHHTPLPAQRSFGDEGAANIMRFTKQHSAQGLEVLVYGENTQRYPARQTKLASDFILKRHTVKNALTVQQASKAIDAGVFHNDVIAVANEDTLFYHEHAFEQGEAAVDAMEQAFGHAITHLKVLESEVSIPMAVQTYLFNSQLITLPDSSMAIIAPTESQESSAVKKLLTRFVEADSNRLQAVHYLNLRESMRNGGGPACLRLRVVLTEAELQAMHQGVIFDNRLYDHLGNWIERHYRDTLSVPDLQDIALLAESTKAHTELEQILGFST